MPFALMPFAASMVVFPGGRLDPVDREDPVDRVGPVDRVDPVDADRLDPIRRCAIRETTEETGVVLADTDLHPWARWITPEFEPRRYDTWFFVAIMPTGQNAADISGETERAEWSTPQAALVAERSSVIKMLPPTMSILIELADCPTVADVIDHVHERQIEPVLPGIVKVPDGWRFRYPTAPASERSS